MSTEYSKLLTSSLSELVPGARLAWQPVPGVGIQGFLLDESTGDSPIPPEVERRVMDSPPFWSLLWPSGFKLCRMFGEVSMTSRVCVDLGCGSGLVAVTAARRGASRVVAADCDPLAQQAAAVNALGNGASVETTGFWSPEKCSTLIFADFLYDEQNLPLLETLGSLAEEVVVMDCRLQTLASPEFSYLGRCDGVGVPDLDPHREFGTLRFWYRGERADCWQKAFEKDAGT